MKGDILVCRGNTLIDRLIQWITQSDVSHTVMIVSDNGDIVDTNIDGVFVNNLSNRDKNYYTLRCTTLTEEQREKIVAYALSRVGKRYDIFQLFNILVYRLFGIRLAEDNPNKDVCIEVFVDAFRSIDIDLVPGIPSDMVEPSDLVKSPHLIIIPNC